MNDDEFWTPRWPDDPSDYLVNVRLDGDPVTKLRPVVTREGGAFTPSKTLNAEVVVAAHVRRALPRGFQKDDAHEWGLRAVFRTADRTRRDFDNFLKLIADALNGLVWKDDVQVIDGSFRIVRAVPDPCTLLRLYRLGPLSVRPVKPPRPRRSPTVERLTAIRAATSFRRRT